MRFIGLGILAGLLVWSADAAAQRNAPAPKNNADKGVYLKAALPLDEPRHHCLDIPGHGARVNVARPLTVHTCKEGIWNLDERFVRNTIDKGELRMPQYDLCVAAEAPKAGAKLVLVECGSTPLAGWEYKEARLTLTGHPALCMTIGPEPSELTPGGRRMPSRNMSRSVGMDTCSEDAIERQLWTFADPLPISGPLMPPKGK